MDATGAVIACFKSHILPRKPPAQKDSPTMKIARVFLPLLVAATFTIARCNCGQNADEGGGSKIDGGDDGGYNTDGGPGSTCLTNGSACMTTAGGVCCSGNCSGGICAP